MKQKRSGFTVMRRLIRLVRPLAPFMVLAVTLGVAGFACAIFLTIFGGWAMLDVLGLSAPAAAGTLFILAGIAALLRGVLRYGEQACNHYIAFKLLALVRDKVFGALRRLCPAKLEGRDKGDLIAVITADVELLEVFYAHTISPVLIAIFMSLGMSLFIGSYHPLLGVCAAAAYLTIGAALPIFISRISGSSGNEFRAKAGQLSGYVLDSLRGVREVLQYDFGAQRVQGLRAGTEDLLATEEDMKKKAALGTALTNSLIIAFGLVMLCASCALYFSGKVGFEGVLIPVIAMMSSFGPVVALASLGSTLQNTLAAGNRVLDILDETPLVPEVSDREPVVFTGASCENVSFSYDEEEILHDVSLSIPKGRVIGITGRSGSGKSTLLRLLMRFWDADSGTVRLSGRSIKQVNTHDLRRAEGFVTQDTHLFHDSIANNLRIAKPTASDEELIAACKKASVHDFILTLPQGYDTPVGELGDTLSSGERQRLGLARAFLHDAPMLLLDEPTSNLDSLNEGVILASLAAERVDKTIVLVSHRASTMALADDVYSAERGRVS